ncbi:hypothetical protein WR25_19793 isoform E [Diploscapter pachys]|uniref:Uncharacterized protein n=1 Tax=Diploscapter pachys TaxID=2018661 RepID=A0A2A2JE30_9BILA|nr:hypothetical protein WR25_19793 isoform A [Diploscapter pachys]PAV59879.1 hypothetical protein WR25_19793 isoform B [Diploscapter pachys]PAV59881.1 hypothetical protein WR25_19793 isoform D [Diploscapter pachys]PAV59882.1 hypothetical protein WR25_19793 isoform E [Diploscapter pachys]
MLFRCLIFSVLVSIAIAAVAIMKQPLGQTVTLDLGKDVVTWLRKRDAGSGEESIRYCDEAHSNQPNCNKWVDESGKVVDGDRSQVFANGTLVIEKFETADVGDYYSNDEMKRVKFAFFISKKKIK